MYNNKPNALTSTTREVQKEEVFIKCVERRPLTVGVFYINVWRNGKRTKERKQGLQQLRVIAPQAVGEIVR